MPGDLTSYLAERYLVADTKPKKKKKRKRQEESGGGGGGLIIKDDDATGWADGQRDDEDEEKMLDGAVAGTTAEFRKAKTSKWKTVTKATERDDKNDDDEKAAADAIIEAAAAETAAAATEGDLTPAVAMMSDGTHAGLQSAADVVAQLAKRRDAEQRQWEEERKKAKRDQKDEEVVYRDATGRRVDVALRRQELRSAAEAAEKKAKMDQEALLRGETQKRAAEERRTQLAEAALLPLARKADDAELNADLKAQTRWNDPMAPFLKTKAAPSTKGSGGKSSSGGARSRKPEYNGPAAPNRYGIRPGYRWDGVDRSNGFEMERFKAINQRERNKGLEYQWQMDVE